MDTIETTEITETETSFGVEIAKSFALAAAASIGTLAGFVAVGAAVGTINKIKANREAKKNPTNETK